MFVFMNFYIDRFGNVRSNLAYDDFSHFGRISTEDNHVCVNVQYYAK